MRPGDSLELVITDLGTGGEGVGRAGAVVVFVSGALPGDKVRCRIERPPSGPRGFARANLTEIVEPSLDRVEPACSLSSECGGCQLLALSYPAQLAWKTQVVKEALKRVGHLDSIPVRSCLGAERPTGYRNKAQFPVVPEGVGGARRVKGLPALRSGLYRRGSHEVVPVDACLLQHPVNNRVLSRTVRAASDLGIQAYDEDEGEGQLRHVLARVSRDGRQAMAVLVTRSPVFPMGRRLAERLRREVPEIKTVVQNVNSRRTNVILGPRNIILYGSGYITDTLGGLKFRVSPSSFLQVNPDQAEVLYQVASEMAVGARRVADVYCGVGTITLFLARAVETLEEIIGIESNPAAVRDAAASAKANGVGNASFVTGDAAAVLAAMSREGYRLDTIVLDPPRRGCEPGVLHSAARLGSRRIVYVSCNPATLARDLSILSAEGYCVDTVQPVDMFPQTIHVEVCVLLVKR